MSDPIKTSYGLVYLSDASLCVTVRKDDTPIDGVSSFAIEYPATNKIATEGHAAQDWTKWSHWNSATYWQSCSQYDDKEWGKVFKGVSKNVSYIFDYFPYNVSKGTQYIFSVYVKNDSPGVYQMRAYIIDSSYNAYAEDIQTVTITREWQRLVFKLTPSANVSGAGIGIRLNYDDKDLTGITWWFAYPQFEAMPYVTSFVDGSRVRGKWELRKNYFKELPDWVFAAWIKPSEIIIPASSNTEHHTKPIIYCGLQDVYDSDEFDVIFNYNDDASQYQIEVRNFKASNQIIKAQFPLEGPPHTEWHFVVIMYDGNKLTIYLDGNKLGEVNQTIDWSFAGSDHAFIGSVPSNYKRYLDLIANVFIGRLSQDWLDENYIKWLFEERVKFQTPLRVPVL